MTDDDGILELAARRGSRPRAGTWGRTGSPGSRYVRTPEGAEKYGLPIGAKITRDAVARANARGRNYSVPEDDNDFGAQPSSVGRTRRNASELVRAIRSAPAPRVVTPDGPKKVAIGERGYGFPEGSRAFRSQKHQNFAIVRTPDFQLVGITDKGIAFELDGELEKELNEELDDDASETWLADEPNPNALEDVDGDGETGEAGAEETPQRPARVEDSPGYLNEEMMQGILSGMEASGLDQNTRDMAELQLRRNNDRIRTEYEAAVAAEEEELAAEEEAAEEPSAPTMERVPQPTPERQPEEPEAPTTPPVPAKPAAKAAAVRERKASESTSNEPADFETSSAKRERQNRESRAETERQNVADGFQPLRGGTTARVNNDTDDREQAQRDALGGIMGRRTPAEEIPLGSARNEGWSDLSNYRPERLQVRRDFLARQDSLEPHRQRELDALNAALEPTGDRSDDETLSALEELARSRPTGVAEGKVGDLNVQLRRNRVNDSIEYSADGVAFADRDEVVSTAEANRQAAANEPRDTATVPDEDLTDEEITDVLSDLNNALVTGAATMRTVQPRINALRAVQAERGRNDEDPNEGNDDLDEPAAEVGTVATPEWAESAEPGAAVVADDGLVAVRQEDGSWETPIGKLAPTHFEPSDVEDDDAVIARPGPAPDNRPVGATTRLDTPEDFDAAVRPGDGIAIVLSGETMPGTRQDDGTLRLELQGGLTLPGVNHEDLYNQADGEETPEIWHVPNQEITGTPSKSRWNIGDKLRSLDDILSQKLGTRLRYRRRHPRTNPLPESNSTKDDFYTTAPDGKIQSEQGALLPARVLNSGLAENRVSIAEIPEQDVDPLDIETPRVVTDPNDYTNGDLVSDYRHLRDMAPGQQITMVVPAHRNGGQEAHVVLTRTSDEANLGGFMFLVGRSGRGYNSFGENNASIFQAIHEGRIHFGDIRNAEGAEKLAKIENAGWSRDRNISLWEGGPEVSEFDLRTFIASQVASRAMQGSYYDTSLLPDDSPFRSQELRKQFSAKAIEQYSVEGNPARHKPAMIRLAAEKLGLEYTDPGSTLIPDNLSMDDFNRQVVVGRWLRASGTSAENNMGPEQITVTAADVKTAMAVIDNMLVSDEHGDPDKILKRVFARQGSPFQDMNVGAAIAAYFGMRRYRVNPDGSKTLMTTIARQYDKRRNRALMRQMLLEQLEGREPGYYGIPADEDYTRTDGKRFINTSSLNAPPRPENPNRVPEPVDAGAINDGVVDEPIPDGPPRITDLAEQFAPQADGWREREFRFEDNPRYPRQGAQYVMTAAERPRSGEYMRLAHFDEDGTLSNTQTWKKVDAGWELQGDNPQWLASNMIWDEFGHSTRAFVITGPDYRATQERNNPPQEAEVPQTIGGDLAALELSRMPMGTRIVVTSANGSVHGATVGEDNLEGDDGSSWSMSPQDIQDLVDFGVSFRRERPADTAQTVGRVEFEITGSVESAQDRYERLAEEANLRRMAGDPLDADEQMELLSAEQEAGNERRRQARQARQTPGAPGTELEDWERELMGQEEPEPLTPALRYALQNDINIDTDFTALRPSDLENLNDDPGELGAAARAEIRRRETPDGGSEAGSDPNAPSTGATSGPQRGETVDAAQIEDLPVGSVILYPRRSGGTSRYTRQPEGWITERGNPTRGNPATWNTRFTIESLPDQPADRVPDVSSTPRTPEPEAPAEPESSWPVGKEFQGQDIRDVPLGSRVQGASGRQYVVREDHLEYAGGTFTFAQIENNNARFEVIGAVAGAPVEPPDERVNGRYVLAVIGRDFPQRSWWKSPTGTRWQLQGQYLVSEGGQRRALSRLDQTATYTYLGTNIGPTTTVTATGRPGRPGRTLEEQGLTRVPAERQARYDRPRPLPTNLGHDLTNTTPMRQYLSQGDGARDLERGILAALPPGSTAYINASGNGFSGGYSTPDGKSGSFSRYINPEGTRIENAVAHASGYFAQVQDAMFAFYRQHGIQKVGVHGLSSGSAWNGAHTWIRRGFRPDTGGYNWANNMGNLGRIKRDLQSIIRQTEDGRLPQYREFMDEAKELARRMTDVLNERNGWPLEKRREALYKAWRDLTYLGEVTDANGVTRRGRGESIGWRILGHASGSIDYYGVQELATYFEN